VATEPETEKLSGDMEPEELAGQLARNAVHRLAHWAQDQAVEWIGGKAMLGLIGGGLVASALALISFPLAVGVAAAIVVVGATGLAVLARRLMHRAQRAGSWTEIGRLRERQDRLRAENEVDRATLALASGDHRAMITRPRQRDLLGAVLRIHHQAAETRAASHPQPASAKQHRDRGPQPIQTASILRRVDQRTTEIEALEGEIQALAVPTDKLLQTQARERRKEARARERAALEADRAARERRRRGLRPTVPPGAERTLEVAFDPTGTRDVRHTPQPPTPEEIAGPRLPGGSQASGS
jgi:hypothetical protein